MIAVCCSAVCLAAAEIAIEKVSPAGVKDSNRLQRVANPDQPGEQVLQVRARTAIHDFTAPGDGWRKVRLQFRAKVGGSATVENNPLQEILPEISDLSAFRIAVTDASGKVLHGRPGNYPFRGFIGSGEWDTYGHVFYLRPGENRISLSVVPGKNSLPLYLSDLQLLAIQEDEITANGDFSFKTGNRSCGIAMFERAGCVEKSDDGRMQINTMPNGGVSMEPLPVIPRKHYVLTVAWNKHTDSRIRSQITFFDAGNKKLNYYVWYLDRKTAKAQGGDLVSNYEFVAPEKAGSAGLYFYSGVIRSYSLKEKTGSL